MYKLLLILKYLRKRRIAWVSLAAVMLCTAMVLVVISVMGGWLRMFRETYHALIGDLIIYRQSQDGFAHYQEMIDGIEKLPEVKAAAPAIHTFAVTNIDGQLSEGVVVYGIDLKKIPDINGFARSLFQQPQWLKEKSAEFDKQAADQQAEAKSLLARMPVAVGAPPPDAVLQIQNQAQRLADDAALMRKKAAEFPTWDPVFTFDDLVARNANNKVRPKKEWMGAIVGSGVIGLNPDEKTHKLEPKDFVFSAYLGLSMIRFSSKEASLGLENVVTENLWLSDISRTGVYQIDQNAIYLPFDLLQRDIQMDDHPILIDDKQVIDPARCNEIEISLKPGFEPIDVLPKIQKVVADVSAKYPMELTFFNNEIKTETWDQHQADILSAVEHEKSLLVILFAIVSLVAVFLIFCIFYMIVVEKTRDIGIIKSVGATSGGVAQIFLGYGLVIGIVGAGLGLLLGYLVIHNINELHAWMSARMGISIWNAKTYLFDTIPNTMDPKDVAVIVTVAILSSVLGAIVPALRAARMNPVEALRWE